MFTLRIGCACLAIALSTLNAVGQGPQIAAVSGRDELALYAEHTKLYHFMTAHERRRG
jgi:hypothetical protein